MLGKTNKTRQTDLFRSKLENIINLKNPICLLSEAIPWNEFEKGFERFYRLDFGRPAKPVRLMVSLLILKQMYNESDETVVARWCENPYWQYFSGEEYFQWQLPCDPSELTRFRQRIGAEGVEKILAISIKVHGKAGLETDVIPDTTVQEKNITFPTDTKLHLKIIEKCRKLSEKYSISLRQSYRNTVPRLRFETRYVRIPSRAKQGRRAIFKIKTIAGRLLRDVERKLPSEVKSEDKTLLEAMQRALEQKRESKNKIYSIHEPEVSCIAKGKEHRKYEFGSKVSVLITKSSGIIVGALSFRGNPYDGNTLEPTLLQSERLRGITAEKALVDEGYRGRAKIGETEILRVHQKKKDKYSKYKWRQFFRRRASVEAIISHLKRGCGLVRNYLKGTVGDEINLLLSAAAFNFRKLLSKIAFIFRFFILIFYRIFFPGNLKFSPV